MRKSKSGRWVPDAPERRQDPDGDDTELAAAMALCRAGLAAGIVMPPEYQLYHWWFHATWPGADRGAGT